jgi:group I intron endonuclease
VDKGGFNGIIYLATNQVNGKQYIGQSTHPLEERWQEHCALARSSRCRYVFHKAIRKYGATAFEVHVIETGFVSQEELNAAEARWVVDLKTQLPHGYNTRAGGGSHGALHPRTKKTISLLAKGRKMSAKARAKMSATRIEHFKDPAFRRRHQERQRRLAKNPVTKARQDIARRKRLADPQAMARFRALMASPEIRAKISKGKLGHEVTLVTRAKLSAIRLERNKNYIEPVEVRQHRSLGQQARWAQPGERERILALQNEGRAQPEAIARHQERWEQYRQRPEVQERREKARLRVQSPTKRGASLRAYWATLGVKEQRALNLKNRRARQDQVV